MGALREAEDYGRFSLVKLNRYGEIFEFSVTCHGYVYYPIHASMTPADIEGARHAWVKDDKWMFAHATPAEHHEFADLCESLGLLAVQNTLNTKTAEFMGATPGGPLASQARGQFLAWRAFSIRLQHHARAFALAEPLGHFERALDLHHARTIVGRAMSAVLNEWGAADASAETKRHYQVVRAIALRLALARQQAPTEAIQTWPDHRAAAAAAKKKADAAAEEDDE